MGKVFIKRLIIIFLLLLSFGLFYYAQFYIPFKQANQESKGNLPDKGVDDKVALEAAGKKQGSGSENKSSDKKGGVVYVIPNMEKIEVAKDIVYKTDNDSVLKLDVYHPLVEKSDSKGYPVILIHGKTTDRKFKDAKYFTSWGRLVAASGHTAITFNWRSGTTPKDISDLIVYVREHADELNVADDRMSVIAFSMGVEDGVREALSVDTDFIDSIVAYYGKMPMTILENSSELKLPPMFIVKAAYDQYFPSDSNDEFIGKVRALGCKITEVVHSEGKHGFDLFDDNEQSYEIIKKSLEFIKINSKN